MELNNENPAFNKKKSVEELKKEEQADGFTAGLDPSLAFELQDDEQLHSNLVSTYESLALVSALFLTMIYAFGDGPPEPIEGNLWGDFTDSAINIAGICNGLAVVANLGCTFDCVLLLLRLSEIPTSHTRLFVRTYGSAYMFSPYTLNGLGFWPFLIGIVLNYSLVYRIWAFIPVVTFAILYIAWFTFNWNLHQEPSRAAVLKIIQQERAHPDIDGELKAWLEEMPFSDVKEKFNDTKLTLNSLTKLAKKDTEATLLNDLLKDIGVTSAGDRVNLILALTDRANLMN